MKIARSSVRKKIQLLHWCAHTCEQLYVDVEAGSQHGVPSSATLCVIIVLRQSLSLNLEHDYLLDYLTTKPQGSSCRCLLSTRVTGAPPPAFDLLLFLWVLGIRLRSVSCGGSVLLNESFVQPQEIPFLPTCHIHG